jgi:hypothetical protein
MGMNIRVELCHVDTLRCVVRVEAWDHTGLLASSLGEAPNAEDAEDRAVQRLTRRFETQNAQEHQQDQATEAAAPPTQGASLGHVTRRLESAQHPAPQPASAPTTRRGSATLRDDDASASAVEPPSEAPTDPDDWSEELTAIDFELKRIGWGRDQERQYLERAFGHASRHRLTRYADLIAFLRQLRQIQPGETPDQSAVPIRRGDLITQGDQMLSSLGWSGEQARSFLQQHLNSTSRQQLSDEQLLQFNLLLEEQAMSAKS